MCYVVSIEYLTSAYRDCASFTCGPDHSQFAFVLFAGTGDLAMRKSLTVRTKGT